MIWLLRYWKPLAGLLIVGLALGGMWWWGYSTKAVACELAQAEARAAYQRGMAEMARAEAEMVKQARETERAHAKRLAEIAEQHEQDKRDAEDTHRSVVDGLRAGTIRLRQHWQGCQATSRVSGDAASAALADANARLREADAGAAIGDARRADDWIKRLQDAIRAGQSPE